MNKDEVRNNTDESHEDRLWHIDTDVNDAETKLVRFWPLLMSGGFRVKACQLSYGMHRNRKLTAFVLQTRGMVVVNHHVSRAGKLLSTGCGRSSLSRATSKQPLWAALDCM